MKIIVPVAGVGSKLRPHTHTQPKALVPVAGKPILSHIVDYLVEAGFNEFIFVIGHLGDKIEEYVSGKYPKLKSTFVVQEPREGTGHALWLARDKVRADEDMLIVLGDTLIEFDIASVLKNKHSSFGVKKVDDPRQFGVVEADGAGRIVRVAEKPSIPKSNLAMVGIYHIKDSRTLFDAIEWTMKNNIRTREEFNLTDAIQRMIEQGVVCETFPVGSWFDCGSKANLLETNAIMLKKVDTGKKKYKFKNTVIIHPTIIGEQCDISDSIIGPNVSIGENTTVRSSIISDSIIGAYAELDTAVLHESVIGSDVYLKGLSQSLNIGDSTEIDFS